MIVKKKKKQKQNFKMNNAFYMFVKKERNVQI